MKIVQGLNYRQWQQRNTDKFKTLTVAQQKEARTQGFFNRGWDRVQKSWDILMSFVNIVNNNVVTMFDHKLNKGDLINAIDRSLREAEHIEEVLDQQVDKMDQLLQKATDIFNKTKKRFATYETAMEYRYNEQSTT
ncbi:MAG: hypothetical protein F6K23_36630 [Okeania sp. SIO2C9]|uniref:hypothetical protein n=1 Tax=Okeania sp. SIO2C9 TaxID=2607791 RepID=UPI0013BF72A8|nr:hypothetical protein [Okeania sp. SIO2C9]NEQ78048.1 hypothetical protein [Okeania sp. SIO2C9]